MIKRLATIGALFCALAAAAQTTQPLLQPHQTFVDGSGAPCVGCSLYSYAAGTTTPLATYADSTGVTPNSNPVILDTAGGAQIWPLSGSAYKYILKDSLGSTIWTVDNVGIGSSFCAKTGCTFTGAITNPAGFIGPVTGNVTGNLTGNVTSPNINKVIYAQSGDTVAQAVARLISANGSAGGTLILGPGVWQSGGTSVTAPNIHIQGSGMPRYNNGYTALSGGTIIQGSILATQGADNFWLRDLGVDDGSAYVSGGGTVSDAIAIFNLGSVVGAPQLQNVLVQNVSCLGSSATAAFHCLLVENVNNSTINNVLAVGNTHGVVLKGTNSTVNGVWASWHATDSVNIKSDNYALGNNDVVTNIKIASLFAPGDTGPLFLNSASSETNNPMFNISVSHVQTESVGTPSIPSAVDLSGNLAAYPLTDINLSDITMDWPGGSTSGYACIQLTQSVARVNMNGINCRNYYYAIKNVFPDTTTMNDFVLTGSQISHITGPLAVETNGRWSIIGNSFNAITGNAVVAANGNAQLGNNTCTACGAYFNKTGGTFTFDFRGYQGNVAQPTLSPAILSNTEAMTAGQLVVVFWNLFNAPPDCSATVVSANNAGDAAPYVWIAAKSTSGVTFNASSNVFAGQVSWQCVGSFQ